MKLTLKKRNLKDNMQALFIEYYLGYSINDKGKTIHKRKQENLKLQIFKKPKNQIEKFDNKKTLELANMILIKRKSEINENKFKIFDKKKAESNLIEYFEKIKDTKNSSYSNKKHWINTILHLKKYSKPYTTFKQIDESFILGFKEYLFSKAGLSNNTSASYFETFREGLKKAFLDNLMQDNIASRIRGIKKIDVKREYLNLEELKILFNSECENEKIKNAFLFACLTGLRWCDVSSLKWSDIEIIDNDYRIIYRQKKTKQLEYLYINKQAYELLGKPASPESKVFSGLKYTTDAYYKLQKWSLESGIKKQISFHTARHTFAIMQINLGTDLYTVSKLLGHKNLKNTQIYAKIVDEKKQEAINKIPEFKIN